MTISKLFLSFIIFSCITIGFLLSRYGINGQGMVTLKQCMQAIERNCYTYGVPKHICDSGLTIGDTYE